MDFWHEHLQNPTSVANAPSSAPGLAIYSTKELVVNVTSTEIQLTVGGDLLTFTYTGSTLVEIAARITASSQAVSANPLNNSHLLQVGMLEYGSETTPDGGAVIRFAGHAIRYEGETRIRTLMPYPVSRTFGWYPRVDRGQVSVVRGGVPYVFGIPEYAKQEWSTYFGAPFVDVFSVQAKVRGQKLIQLPYRPIFWYRGNMTIRVNGIPTGGGMIEDVDSYNGFVRLSSPVIPEDRVIVDYTYRENTLIYKEVDLNPSIHRNPGIVDRTVLLYAVPEVSAMGHVRSRTVQHVIARTIVGAISAVPTSDEPALVLGAYQVRANAVLDELQVDDTRTEGGGVLQERHDESLQRNREMHSITEFGRYDGTPFPGAVSGVLRLPHSILDSLEEDHIEQLVRKHLAVGSNILLDFDA